MGESCPSRGDDFFFGHAGQPVANIVPNGIEEEDVFLSDHGDLFAQRTNGRVMNVNAVDEDPPGSQFVEPGQQVYESGFPGAAGADESNDFAAASAEIDVAQDGGGVVFVSKRDVRKFDVARKGSQKLRPRLIRPLLIAIEILKNLGRHTAHGLKLLVNVAGTLDGHVGVEHGVKESEELAFGHEVMIDLTARVKKKDGDGDGADEIHQWAGCGSSAH